MEVIQLDKTGKQHLFHVATRITGRNVLDIEGVQTGIVDIFYKSVDYTVCESGYQSIITVNVVDGEGNPYEGIYEWYVNGVPDQVNVSNQYMIEPEFPVSGVLSCNIETDNKMIRLIDIVNGFDLNDNIQVIICGGTLDCDVPIYVGDMPDSFRLFLDNRGS